MESDVLNPGYKLIEIASPRTKEGRYIFNPNHFKITFKVLSQSKYQKKKKKE